MEVRMTRGVVYMVWGKKAAVAAMNSLKTLRTANPSMNVMVVGDQDTAALKVAYPDIQVEHLELDPFRGASFLAGRIKPLLYGLSPWDQTLYVDADTKFRRAPDAGWALLKKWDFLVAETGNRSLADQLCGAKEAAYTREFFGTRHLLYHNSGMLFWKKNRRVEKLFEKWGEVWAEFGGWDEQVALLRALAVTDILFLTLPFTWNTNFPSQAKLLFHDFGQRTAWKFKRRRGRVMTADELRLLASEVRKQPRRMARGGVKGREMREEKEVVTGADVRKEKLRKPKEAPRNKVVRTPRQNKAV